MFDEAGQLTARPGSKQTYDAKGRLTSVTLDDGTVVAYRYDYAGMVAVKETTGPARPPPDCLRRQARRGA